MSDGKDYGFTAENDTLSLSEVKRGCDYYKTHKIYSQQGKNE